MTSLRVYHKNGTPNFLAGCLIILFVVDSKARFPSAYTTVQKKKSTLILKSSLISGLWFFSLSSSPPIYTRTHGRR